MSNAKCPLPKCRKAKSNILLSFFISPSPLCQSQENWSVAHIITLDEETLVEEQYEDDEDEEKAQQ